ncbi:MAG: SMP-30/gluconolactonase/LRE family protein [Sedimentisphaerales bacterium]|nr:SMP-30/gluconolactonase/LRE family protein [Sedimentisphaerales bacterium]
MKISLHIFTWVILILSIGGFASENTSVIAPGAQVQRLVTGFSFTEGPAVDAAGNVFFTDQPNNKIIKWSTNGTLSVFLTPCGRANGLYFDREGNLWTCADEHNELWRIDTQGNVTVVIKNFQGKLLNGPNDLWVMRTGGIYFTDPYFSRSYWNRGPMEQSGQHVYYLTPDMQTLTRVTADLQQPNGIIGTPDGRFLYVADYGAGKTWRYTIQSDGTLSEKLLFCSQGSDGMTIDQEGNLYLTGTGVTVYNRLGNKIETISVPEGTANVTFGGIDRKTLFITARTSLYSLRMRVQGASLLPDFNADECVDFLDYARLLQSWKQDDPNVDLGPATLGDGIIDQRDLSLLAANWLEEVLPVGLKAYWKLDEPNGATAFDYAGTFDATLTGNRLWHPDGGLVHGALEFDGIGDYVSTPYVLDPSEGTFSVFAWIKGVAPGQVIISQKGGADWLSTDSEGKLSTNVSPPAGRTTIPPLVSDVIITDGNWHRVGLVWNGSERILYVDGLEAARDQMLYKLKSSHEGLYIGAGKGLETGSFWSGLIDDVRLYDRTAVP